MEKQTENIVQVGDTANATAPVDISLQSASTTFPAVESTLALQEGEASCKMTTLSTNLKEINSTTTAPVNSDIIKDGDYVIIRMPSGMKKITNIRKTSQVQMGKFGSFKGHQIIGQFYDIPYEIDRDSVKVSTKTILDTIEIDTESSTNNQFINDDQTAQKLSNQEIEQLRADCLAGQVSSTQVIQTLVNNSATFEQKTDFAKAKYIKKKEKKFIKAFTPLKATLKSMCEYYFETMPNKIMEMRVDTLSQMMSVCNVHPGSKLMLLDDTQGMVLSAVMQRMNGDGQVLLIHNKEKERHIIGDYMNFSSQQWSTVNRLHYSRFDGHPDEEVDIEALPKTGLHWEKRNRKIKDAIDAVKKSRAMLNAGDFDGLIMCVDSNAVDILKELYGKVSGSRPVVLYNGYKEVLLPAFNFMRESKEFVNVQLTESWMREYQVPLHFVGTHPMMTMSSSGGYLLSATRVYENKEIEPIDSDWVKLKRKRLE